MLFASSNFNLQVAHAQCNARMAGEFEILREQRFAFSRRVTAKMGHCEIHCVSLIFIFCEPKNFFSLLFFTMKLPVSPFLLLLVSFCQGFHTQQTFRRIHPRPRNDISHPPALFATIPKKGGFGNKLSQQMASNRTSVDEELILTIDNVTVNLTAWANSHPGGVSILRQFHNKNVTKQFYEYGHSQDAMKLLQKFQINHNQTELLVEESHHHSKQPSLIKRWKSKLVSHEDPYWIHKSLGVYTLLHFVFRFAWAMFGRDPSGGMGSNLGKGANGIVVACMIPHLLLSWSSLIFGTVPRERVVGKPMIWKENRWHSIIFGSRSILSTIFCWLSIRFRHVQPWRSVCVFACCLTCLMTLVAADIATAKFQPEEKDSSIAALPFWDGCSIRTQSIFKHFYAYSQFIATSVCALAANPLWPFLMLFPIQFASFLLTLCRKGLISAKGWHIAHAASLLLPFLFSVRVIFKLKSIHFINGIGFIPAILFGLRSMGINKYAIWIPMLCLRLLIGDKFIPFEMW